jgi:glycosyltransferase involved in cell wall biosynthesis
VRVALSAPLLDFGATYRAAGISNYIAGLIQGLQQADPNGDYTIHLGGGSLPAGFLTASGFRAVRSPLPTGSPAVRVLWEQTCLPAVLAAARPDLLHATAFVSPLAWFGPTVVTVYDLSFLLYPQHFNRANRLYLTALTGRSVRRAARVAAISVSTKSDVVRLLGVAEGKVDVVTPALDPEMRPVTPESVEAFRKAKGLPEKFILYVGTLEPRKNVATLVRAFSLARRSLPAARLVIAGARGWGFEQIYEEVDRLGLTGEVHFPGYLPREELPLWYGAARVFAYPSVYEGFGLPVLEALACGATVVCSDVSSMPEAAGGAALLVPPGDAEALSVALVRAFSDDGQRQERRALGLAHAAGFAPLHTGRQMLACYRRALGVSAPVN